MIDDPFADIRPRRRQAAPTPPDDPFADIAPRRDTLTTYARNVAAPEQPSLLSRVGTAAKALGTQAIEHPWETVKGIGKGIGENVVDLADLVNDPVRASNRIAIETQGDPRKALVRTGGAIALGAGPVARLLGAPLGAVALADYGMSAGLGAAQTPDDPAVGASLGLLMNAAADAPGAFKSMRSGMIPKLDGVTAGLAEELAPRFPMRRAIGEPKPVPLGKAAGKMFEAKTIDMIAADKPDVSAAFDTPNPKPGTPQAFPDGYQADPTPITARVADIPRALQLTAKETEKVMREDPATLLRNLLDGLEKVDTPMGPVAPASDVRFGNDRAFAMPDLPEPAKSVIPSALKPLKDTPDVVAASDAVAATLQRPVATPSAFRAPDMPEPTPAPVVAPEPTPAPAAVIPDAPKAPEPVATPAATPVTPDAPKLEPAKDVFINWRTLDNSDAPLGKQTLDRIKSAATTIEERLKQERGFQSLDAQADAALKSQVIQEIVDDPLMIDRKKLKGLTGAQVVAVKDVMNENARMMEVLSQEIASGKLSGDDLMLAQQRMDQLTASTNEALATVVGESARMGRDLGALRVMSKLSTDPDVWMVQAKRALGDTPMTEQIMNDVRRLAREAADACGGMNG